jgi:hypothetical protein
LTLLTNGVIPRPPMIRRCASLVVLLLGCTEPPRVPPRTSSIVRPSAVTSTSTKRPDGLAVALDPSTLRSRALAKRYRALECGLAAHNLVWMKRAYLESLGGAAPSASRVPSFGIDPKDLVLPYERGVRECQVASRLTGVEDPKLDRALVAFADWSLATTKLVEESFLYFRRERHLRDNGARGREIHECLTSSKRCEVSGVGTVSGAFNELEAHVGAVDDALAAHLATHPLDPANQSPTERASSAATEDALELLRALAAAPFDEPAVHRALASLELHAAAVSNGGSDDPWAQLVSPALQELIEAARPLDRVDGKGPSPSEQVAITLLALRLLERDLDALRRDEVKVLTRPQPSAR